jgi:hypothetical protein
MRKTALAMLLAGIMAPAVASAQLDGGVDGMYVAPSPVVGQDPSRPTGYSSDPNGNMGDTGRTQKPVQRPPQDAGAPDVSNNGQEGHTGSRS